MHRLLTGLFLASLIAGVPSVASAQINTQASAQLAPSGFDPRAIKALVSAPRERDHRLTPLADWPSDPPRFAFRNGPFDLGLFTVRGSTLQNLRRPLQEEIESRTFGRAGLRFQRASIVTR